MDWREVELEGDYPHIRVENGKGAHMRVIPLSDVLIEYLHEIPRREGPVISAQVEHPRWPVRYRRGKGGHYANHVGKRANEHRHGVGIEATLHQFGSRRSPTSLPRHPRRARPDGAHVAGDDGPLRRRVGAGRP